MKEKGENFTFSERALVAEESAASLATIIYRKDIKKLKSFCDRANCCCCDATLHVSGRGYEIASVVVKIPPAGGNGLGIIDVKDGLKFHWLFNLLNMF